MLWSVPLTPGASPPLRLRVGVSQDAVLVIEKIFDAGTDVTIGGDPSAALVVTPWSGPTLLLISGKDLLLHLQPGMRLIMCNDDGSERVDGEFEELAAKEMVPPLQITVRSRLNIRVRKGISVFAHYVADEGPPEQTPAP